MDELIVADVVECFVNMVVYVDGEIFLYVNLVLFDFEKMVMFVTEAFVGDRMILLVKTVTFVNYMKAWL